MTMTIRIHMFHAAAALALVDEYDEMIANIRGQGDPLGLVERRGDTYPDFVAVVTSTCRRGGFSS